MKTKFYFFKLYYQFSFKKKDAIFEKSFIPKLSLRYSPFNNEDIKDLDRQINTTNLFSNNRLGLSNSLEGGQSITLGFDYELSKMNKTKNSLIFNGTNF